jgi:putative hydrolase of HD superfamily
MLKTFFHKKKRNTPASVETSPEAAVTPENNGACCTACSADPTASKEDAGSAGGTCRTASTADPEASKEAASEARLKKQFAFLKEIDKEKQVIRQTPIADGSRMEDDAEHAWHMAMCALVLSEYANADIDLARTLALCLCHDLIEIYAGDTYAYDTNGAQEKQAEREAVAAPRLYGLLPDDQRDYFLGLYREFEEQKTPEAKFARTLDNIQPAMLNDATDGISWVEHSVHLSQVLNRNAKTAEGSKVLWDYSRDHFILPHVASGELKKD